MKMIFFSGFCPCAVRVFPGADGCGREIHESDVHADVRSSVHAERSHLPTAVLRPAALLHGSVCLRSVACVILDDPLKCVCVCACRGQSECGRGAL